MSVRNVLFSLGAALTASLFSTTASHAQGHIPGEPGILAELSTTTETPAEPEWRVPWAEQSAIEQENSYNVFLHNGEFHFEQTDLVLPGTGFDFVWKRSYRSRANRQSPIGYNWDHSYNIYIEENAGVLTLYDGCNRAYEYTGTNVWSSPGQFRIIWINGAGDYVVRHRHGAYWKLHGPSAGVLAGKISRIRDRNGNEMTFAYDAVTGDLTSITDTNGRIITIETNAEGFIESVRDDSTTFDDENGCRKVKYAYYVDTDPGGYGGDLQSATSPIVMSTTDNYPNGKTWTYTYTKDTTSASVMSHNIKTITDPKQQTFVQNRYTAPGATGLVGAVNDPDMVERQLFINAGGTSIHYAYYDVTPAESNNYATRRVIINDRVGNVREHYYKDNTLVMLHEFTGRAAADRFTTSISNRPVGKLRATDPDFFETKYTYNAIGLPVEIKRPLGVLEEFVYDDANPKRRSRANLLTRKVYPGNLGGDQAWLCERWVYEDEFQMVKAYADRGNKVTVFSFDEEGNAPILHSCSQPPPLVGGPDSDPEMETEDTTGGNETGQSCPVDENEAQKDPCAERKGGGEGGEGEDGEKGGGGKKEEDPCVEALYDTSGRPVGYNDSGGTGTNYTYHGSGKQKGHLASRTVSGTAEDPQDLTTNYEYDDHGALNKVTDPRGNAVTFEVNALGQTVTATAPPPLNYQRRYYYDANDNLIKEEIDNAYVAYASGNVVTDSSNPVLVTDYVYDEMDNLCTIIREVDATSSITEELAYDANENLILRKYGEATNGNQPYNLVAYQYDERDYLFQSARGFQGPSQVFSQYDYDELGNRTFVKVGIGTSDVRTTEYKYDGFGRQTEVIDPMGNVLEVTFDERDNALVEEFHGELVDVTGSASNTLLSRLTRDFSDRDQLNWIDREIFELDAQGLPVYSTYGPARTSYYYTAGNQIEQTTYPGGKVHTYTYDGARRLASYSPPGGVQLSSLTYDDSSNVTLVVQDDWNGTVGAGSTYDVLNRVTSRMENGYSEERFGYDSRGNIVWKEDGNGDLVFNFYDGLGRLTATLRDSDGDNVANDPDDLKTVYEWDDSSRLVCITDGNLNDTRRAYDDLNRLILERREDGALYQVGTGATWATESAPPDLSAFTSGYNVHGDQLTRFDPNGTRIDQVYDANGRVRYRDLIPGPGVAVDTTDEEFRYDGLGRVVYASNDNTVIDRTLDSLGNLLTETFSIESDAPFAVANLYNESSNRFEINYPGGRVVRTKFDDMDRKDFITEGSLLSPPDLIDFEHGGYAELSRTWSSGHSCTKTYYYDSNDVGPGEDLTVRAPKTFDFGSYEITSTWDQDGNRKSWESNFVSLSFDYDTLDRLETVSVEQGGSTVRDTTYNHDNANNRTTVAETPGAPPYAGTYTLDAGSPTFDAEANQYTSTPEGDRSYDNNGNLIEVRDSVGAVVATMKYDGFNRMVEYSQAGGDIYRYVYDCFGRRLVKERFPGVLPEDRTIFAYGGDGAWQMLEERDGAGATLATYVHGLGFDDVVEMERDVDGNGTPENYIYMSDDLGSVHRIVGGGVIEEYLYSDYGAPTEIKSGGVVVSESAIDNPLMFAGAWYDEESGFYYHRTRYYDPVHGRYTSSDTIGTWGDDIGLGNGFTYVGNNPWSLVDRFGMGWFSKFLDAAQVALDVAGMVPGIGNAADIVNAGISVARGDYAGAAMSMAAAVPGAGLAAGAAKIARKADKLLDGAKTAAKRGDKAKDASKAGGRTPEAEAPSKGPQAEKTPPADETASKGKDGGNGKDGDGKVDDPDEKPDCGGRAEKCFVAGTLVVSARESVAIESVRVGDGVASRSDGSVGRTTEPADPDFHDEVDETWSVVELSIDRPGFGHVGVTLLRPTEWLERTGAEAGETLRLRLPEMGIDANASVTQVRPVRQLGRLEAGERRVTGVFVTHNARVLELEVEDLDVPLGTTAAHPFWSADRSGWVPAGKLRQGERIQRADGGVAKLLGLRYREQREAVYNLEVHRDHTYFVSEASLWVHNDCESDAGNKGEGSNSDATEGGDRAPKLAKSQSPQWQKLKEEGRAKGGRVTTGSGKKTRHHEWDHTHGDIEVYDAKGRHLGSMHPITGLMYKPPVPGRRINL